MTREPITMSFAQWLEFHFKGVALDAIAARLGIGKSTVIAFRDLQRYPRPDLAERLDAHAAGLIDFDQWRRDFLRAKANRTAQKAQEAPQC